MSKKSIKIATRGSALALWQANHVRDAVLDRVPDWQVELLVIKTTGDRILDRPLAEIGGKALFVKEIEQALLDVRADIAVHSKKDVPAELAPGLTLAAVSAREDPSDALCIAGAQSSASLDQLPERARVGTSSMRRQCQLLAARPDLAISTLRGNVPTRLGKLDSGDFDAVVLASAGLIRLGFGDRISQKLGPDICLPAVGQGVLGIETRSDDDELVAVVRDAMHDPGEAMRVGAERAFLARLGGSCQTPLAAHAVREDSGQLAIDGMCGRPDGSELLRVHRSAKVATVRDAEALGRTLAEDLLDRGAQTIIDECIDGQPN